MQIQQTNDDMLTAVLYELSVLMNYVVTLSPQSITSLAQGMNILELDVDVGLINLTMAKLTNLENPTDKEWSQSK